MEATVTPSPFHRFGTSGSLIADAHALSAGSASKQVMPTESQSWEEDAPAGATGPAAKASAMSSVAAADSRARRRGRRTRRILCARAPVRNTTSVVRPPDRIGPAGAGASPPLGVARLQPAP